MPLDDLDAFVAGRLNPQPPDDLDAFVASRVGNVDLHNRPVVNNADGTYSTVRSKSFNFGGKEVLLPTVSDDGRIMSDQETIDQYRRTGKHLGIFNSPSEATAAAQKIHEQQAAEYAPPRVATPTLNRLGITGADVKRAAASPLPPESAVRVAESADPNEELQSIQRKHTLDLEYAAAHGGQKPDDPVVQGIKSGALRATYKPVAGLGAVMAGLPYKAGTNEAERNISKWDTSNPEDPSHEALHGAGEFIGGAANPLYFLQPELKLLPYGEKVAFVAGGKLLATLPKALMPVAEGVAGYVAKQGLNVPIDMITGAVSHMAETGTLPSGEDLKDQGKMAFVMRKVLGLLHLKPGESHAPESEGTAPSLTDDVRASRAKHGFDPETGAVLPVEASPSAPAQTPSVEEIAPPAATGGAANAEIGLGERRTGGRPSDEQWASMSDAEKRAHVNTLTNRLTESEVVPGVANRRAWNEQIKGTTDHVASIDIDNLKPINDTFGHLAGDSLIAANGEALRQAADEIGAKVAHISGDEFRLAHDDPAALSLVVDRAHQILAERQVEYENPDGTTGVVPPEYVKGFSHGIGPNEAAAEDALRASKRERQLAGIRTERPASVVDQESNDGRNDQTGIPIQNRGLPAVAAEEVTPEVADIRNQRELPQNIANRPIGKEISLEDFVDSLESAHGTPHEAKGESGVPSGTEWMLGEPRGPGEPPEGALPPSATLVGRGPGEPPQPPSSTPPPAAPFGTPPPTGPEDFAGASRDPNSKDLHTILRTFKSGQEGARSADAFYLSEDIDKALPDHVDREALTFVRDFWDGLRETVNRPELQKLLDGTSDLYGRIDPKQKADAVKRIQELRPVIERAMNPTPQMLAVNRRLTDYYGGTLTEGKALGVLDSTIAPEEYITHLLYPKESSIPLPDDAGAGRNMSPGAMSRFTRFAKERAYPTVADAIIDGASPRSLDAATAVRIYGDKHANAVASRMLVNKLEDMNLANWIEVGSQPSNWKKFGGDSSSFQRAQDSKVIGLYMPAPLADALRPLADPDHMMNVKGFTTARAMSAYIKSVELGLSAFHARALGVAAAGNMGAIDSFKALAQDLRSPEFREIERIAIEHGLKTRAAEDPMEAYRSVRESSTPTKMEQFRSLPGVKQIDQAVAATSHVTFDIMQRKYKVYDFSIKQAAWMAEHPSATSAELAAARRGIASEINSVYGGLNWDALGLSRTERSISRAVFLAPDWTFSNWVTAKSALTEGGPAGNAARKFWARSFINGVIATQVASFAITGLRTGHPETSKDPTMVYMGKDASGREVYQNIFFSGAPQDAITMVKNAYTDGAPTGVGRTVLNKVNPIIKTGIQIGEGRDYSGRPLSRRSDSFLVKSAKDAAYGATQLAPVPFSARDAWRMAHDKKVNYAPWEYASTLAVGAKPQHVLPSQKQGLLDVLTGSRSNSTAMSNEELYKAISGQR